MEDNKNKKMGRLEVIGRTLGKLGTTTGKKMAKKVIMKPVNTAINTALTDIGLGLATEGIPYAKEAFNADPLGSTPDMPEYYLERGVRDPEEQQQKASLYSFKQDIKKNYPYYSPTPTPYDKPEERKYKEDVLKAKNEGTLRDNYVEDNQEDLNKRFMPLLAKLR